MPSLFSLISSSLLLLLAAASPVSASLAFEHDPLQPRALATTANLTAARTSFGLKADGATTINSNSGISIGFHIDWVHNETAQELNDKLGKPASIMGSYIHLFLNNISSPNAYAELESVKPYMVDLAGVTIYSPAVLPQFALGNWTEAMSQQLANEMKALNDAGITVWLRFAYEMNGYWMDFGLDPTHYIPVWQSLTTIIRATTNNTFLLWSPNILASNIGPNDPTGYNTFYPGADYVDIAGLSFYYLGNGQYQNTFPESNYFTSNFQAFYDLFGDAHPIVISETSCPTHYNLPASLDNLYQDAELPDGAAGIDWGIQTLTSGGNGTEVDRKAKWLDECTGTASAELYPNLAAVMWFNLAKAGGADGVHLYLNDFRIVQDPLNTTTVYFRNLIGDPAAFAANATLPGDIGSTTPAATSTSSGKSSSSGGGTKIANSASTTTSTSKTGQASRMKGGASALVLLALGMVVLA